MIAALTVPQVLGAVVVVVVGVLLAAVALVLAVAAICELFAPSLSRRGLPRC